MSFSDWPWQYSFPPFFTLQPNLETREKQLKAWSELVLKYCESNNKYLIDVREAESSPLFHNGEIQRTLSGEGVLEVMKYLEKFKKAEPADKGKWRWLVLWHSLEEWASTLYSWASSSGHINSVCTLYEIINAPAQPFTGMDEQVLIKVLSHLEKNNNAEIIVMDDSKGVKFF